MNDREKWRERVRDIRASGTTRWDDDDDDIFPKGISVKVSSLAQLEFEPAYYNVTIHYVSYCAKESSYKVTGCKNTIL